MEALRALYNNPEAEGIIVFAVIAALLVLFFLVVLFIQRFRSSSEVVSYQQTHEHGEPVLLDDSALQTIETPLRNQDKWPLWARIGLVTAALSVVTLIGIWNWPSAKSSPKKPVPDWVKPIPEPEGSVAPFSAKREEFLNKVAKAKKVDVPDIQLATAEARPTPSNTEMSSGQCRIYADPGMMIYFKKYSRGAKNMKLTRSIRSEEPQGGPGGYLTEAGESGAEVTPPTGCFVDRGNGKEPCDVIDDVTAIALCKRKK